MYFLFLGGEETVAVGYKGEIRDILFFLCFNLSEGGRRWGRRKREREV